MSAIISGMCSVARGERARGSRMPSASTSAKKRFMKKLGDLRGGHFIFARP